MLDHTPSPGGPVPIPYPNIAKSADLANGTKTILVDGGNMAANFGSELSRSSGDEAGTTGGVASATFMKEATWLSFSFDVFLEGKGACRLSDKMLMNHGNTMCCAGFIQEFLKGPKGPNECAELFQRIVEIVGEGATGHNSNGIRGLAKRFAQQITGKGGPNDPMDRPVSPQFPSGSNSWMRHDHELNSQQDSLAKHLRAYDDNCKGGPPPPSTALDWATKPRPKPQEWKGPAISPASRRRDARAILAVDFFFA